MTMKRMGLLAIVAASLLVGCTPITAGFDALASAATQAGPSANAALAAADATVLDEKAAIAVEVAYQASALAILTATRAGLIKGETATLVAAADERAFKAVCLTRAAYNFASQMPVVASATEACRPHVSGTIPKTADAAASAVSLIKNLLATLKGS